MQRDDIQPLFDSGFDACRFAYAYSSQQYAMTAMAKIMRGASVGTGKGLVGLDGAAVAGTIKRHVEGLDDQSHAAIMARHEPVRGRAVVAASIMVQFVLPALGTGAHNRRMVLALVCRYFGIPNEDGRKYQLAHLASKFDMSDDTIQRRWASARLRLEQIEVRAQCLIDDSLSQSGIVGRKKQGLRFFCS